MPLHENAGEESITRRTNFDDHGPTVGQRGPKSGGEVPAAEKDLNWLRAELLLAPNHKIRRDHRIAPISHCRKYGRQARRAAIHGPHLGRTYPRRACEV